MKGMKKSILTVMVIIMGFMALSLVVMIGGLLFEEPMSMLIIDVFSLFDDNGRFAKKIILVFFLVFLLFLFWVIFTAGTEELNWKVKFFRFKKELILEPLKMSRAYIVVFAIFTVLFLTVLTIYAVPYLKWSQRDALSWKGDSHIAHALGGIEGKDYTNSMEAFLYNYGNGVRTFEVDFSVTSDEQLVCWHGWDNEEDVLSLEEFLSQKIKGVYTPMALSDLLKLMMEYEDIYVITDSKSTDWANVQKEFGILVQTAREIGAESVLDRFVVQLYNYEMYYAVEGVYHFNSYILTLYKMKDLDDRIFLQHCRFCRENGIKDITMWYYLATDRYVKIADRYGIGIYVHTVNDFSDVRNLGQIGVKGFYTDFISPDEIRQCMQE